MTTTNNSIQTALPKITEVDDGWRQEIFDGRRCLVCKMKWKWNSKLNEFVRLRLWLFANQILYHCAHCATDCVPIRYVLRTHADYSSRSVGLVGRVLVQREIQKWFLLFVGGLWFAHNVREEMTFSRNHATLSSLSSTGHRIVIIGTPSNLMIIRRQQRAHTQHTHEAINCLWWNTRA